MFITNYIIFDLEFNSTKINNTDKHINEIIEIGAVKLDNNFNETDSYTSLIKPVFSKKLNSYVKKLTHIDEALLKDAKPFEEVINNFISWCSPNNETVFLTWSNTDLHVLVENYNEILKTDKIEFIENYTDLQKYIQNFIITENNNQISLKSAAEFYKINTDNFNLHRAEDDSRVCSKLLKLSYNKEIFNNYIKNINNKSFFNKLLFKPYIISDLKSEDIDKNNLYFKCPVCDDDVKFTGKYNPKIKAFTNILKCKNCKKKIAVTFRFKRNFESISVSKRAKEYVKKKYKDNKTANI